MFLHEGKEYARVSDILKPFSDFSHIDEAVLRNKTDIGTQVHNAISDDINGSFPSPGKRGSGYFQSYQFWRLTLNPTFIQSEQRYFDDKKKLTGCIDALVKIPGDPLPILVDFKTSAQESPITWPMQGHLYHYLLEESGIRVGKRFLFVKLDKLGSLPTVFEYKFDKNTHAKCMDAIDFYWKMRKDDCNLLSS